MGPLERCHGRAEMEARAVAQVPAIERMSRPAADQGTIGHAVVAQTLSLIYHRPGGWGNPADAFALMASHIEDLEAWTRDAVRRCVSYAVALIEKAAKDYRWVTVQIERHLSGKGIDIKRGGTADLIVVCQNQQGDAIKCIVADWKLGFLDQGHAADHLQLACYAVMTWDKYRPEDLVEGHLAQGRRQEFTCATYDSLAIMGVRDRIKSAVWEAIKDEPELNPCIDACRYCKALLFCAPLRERLMHAAEQLALLGADPRDRLRLAEDAALCRRFAEDARELAKVWSAEIQSEQAKANEADPK